MADRKYFIYIRGDTLEDATEETAHLLYFFLNRMLQHQRSHPEKESGQFEEFALQVLALLQKYRALYTERALGSSGGE